jgi:hypothetical protein
VKFILLIWQTGSLGSKRDKKSVDVHPTNIICSDDIKDTKKEDSIIRLAEYVLQNKLTGPGSYQTGRELLLNLIKLPIDRPQVSEDANPAIMQVMKMENNVFTDPGTSGHRQRVIRLRK